MLSVIYPKFIEDISDDIDGQSMIYILETEPRFYKFGISRQLKNRLKTHYRHIAFIKIIHLFDCTCDSIMQSTETDFKHYAKETGILRTKYKLTEIIEIDNIEHIIKWFQDKINQKLLLHQPPNQQHTHVKNDDIEIIFDKVRFEQEIRILKEQAAARDIRNKELKEKVRERDQCLIEILKRLDKVEKTNAVAIICSDF
jgi:predicted GIY-YIG superfamily endonuclease